MKNSWSILSGTQYQLLKNNSFHSIWLQWQTVAGIASGRRGSKSSLYFQWAIHLICVHLHGQNTNKTRSEPLWRYIQPMAADALVWLLKLLIGTVDQYQKSKWRIMGEFGVRNLTEGRCSSVSISEYRKNHSKGQIRAHDISGKFVYSFTACSDICTATQSMYTVQF